MWNVIINKLTYLILNVTISSKTLCVTYLDNFFSSMPFLCNVAIKSVNALDIRNCNSIIRPANINGPCGIEIKKKTKKMYAAIREERRGEI